MPAPRQAGHHHRHEPEGPERQGRGGDRLRPRQGAVRGGLGREGREIAGDEDQAAEFVFEKVKTLSVIGKVV